MEINPTRMCELLVGLPAVNVLGVEDVAGMALRVHVESRVELMGCGGCGTRARVKDRSPVVLVDLPCFGRSTRLVWHKQRWHCPEVGCSTGSWTVVDEQIAPPRARLTARAARWATRQVGAPGRPVERVADELGCDSQTEIGAAIGGAPCAGRSG